MELKNKIWMNGSLEWYAVIDGDMVLLGRREVPIPLEEGDKWTNEFGDMFQVMDGAIQLIGRTVPPDKYW